MTGATSAPAPAVRAKIAKSDSEAISSIEIEVARCINELESNPQCEIQGDLAFIKIAGAIDLSIAGDENKKVRITD